MLDTIVYYLGLAWIMSWLTYAIPQIIVKYRAPQNLKSKYGAKWALVTGGSSGIGEAVVKKLADQGINVVVAAFPDPVLDKAMSQYKEAYPALEFRKVGVNLAKAGYMKDLEAATNDIDVSVLVNNAGYIQTGFFAETALEKQMANHNCNATAAMEITHHFVRLMREKKLKGCVTFTSSPAGFMPCPFSSMYGATKAYLTLFGQSIAPEIHSDGIDVLVIHPSPVASRFYDNTHALDALVFFKNTATGPEAIADMLLRAVGRIGVVDQGYYPMCVKTLLKLVDVNFMGDMITTFARHMGDFKAMKQGKPKAN